MPTNTATIAQAVEDTQVPNDVATPEQQPVVNEADAGGEAPQPDEASIPAKFRGKSAQDIAQAYVELERHAGKLGSEKSHYEKELETAKQRASEMEQRLQAEVQRFQQQQQSYREVPKEEDPLSSFDENFEKDPREAVKSLGKTLIEETRKTKERIALEARASQAADYYSRQMRENPDFVEREKDMQRLAQRYASRLRPEHINDPETIDLLYKLARAERMDSYIDSAVKKSKAAGDMVKQEKRGVFSESAGASQNDNVKFDDLTIEEMQRALGRIE